MHVVHVALFVLGCLVLGTIQGCRTPRTPDSPPPELPSEPTASSGN